MGVAFFALLAWISIEFDRANIARAKRSMERLRSDWYETVDRCLENPISRSMEKAYVDRLIREVWADANIPCPVDLPPERMTILHPDEADEFRDVFVRHIKTMDKVEYMCRLKYGDKWSEHYDEQSAIMERIRKELQDAIDKGEL